MEKPLYTPGTERQISDSEQQIVNTQLQIFSQVTAYRNQGFAGHWEEVAELIEPTFRNTFIFGNRNTPGEKKTHKQVDATGMMANTRFASICDSLITPRNQIYQRVMAGGDDADYVMKDRKSRLWFDQVTKIHMDYRYAPNANFSGENNKNYRSLGAFGNMCMFTDEYDDPLQPGLRYRSVPLGECFFRENHQGQIDSVIRWMRMTARQAEQKWPGMLPANLRTALEANSEQLFNFLHCVHPRDDFDRSRLDAKGKRFQSIYISMEGKCLMFKRSDDWEGGYRSFPYSIGRLEQGPGEVYGRGWAMTLLPALKTLNAEKAVFLRQGHLAVDPVRITNDDGIVGFKNRPGAMNPGGVTAKGEKLVHNLETGDIQIAKEMLQEERSLINDGANVTLFQILLKDRPQMSATEVIERANEKGILLAPTMGRQQTEYLGVMTPRELDILDHQGKLPQMPPRLREARGSWHFKVIYDNPLSRMAKAQNTAGFSRTLELCHQVAANTGDASVYDPFKFETAIPEIAHENGVPERWMDDDDGIAAKQKARAKAQQQENQIRAAAGQAAIMNAQTKMTKVQGEQPQQAQQPQQPGV